MTKVFTPPTPWLVIESEADEADTIISMCETRKQATAVAAQKREAYPGRRFYVHRGWTAPQKPS